MIISFYMQKIVFEFFRDYVLFLCAVNRVKRSGNVPVTQDR